MSVRTSDKRAFLNGIKWDADEARITLKDGLKAALRGQFQEISTGKVLIGTAGNGQTVQFGLPTSLDAATAIRVVQELWDLYEAAEASVSDSTSEALIFAEMKDRLKAVRSFTYDHSLLRC